jgi:hypothetical protein
MKIYALIKNNIVENTIVAEESFISLISNQYDSCVRIDNIIPAQKYWSKEGEENLMTQPMTQEYWSKEGESDLYVDPVDETWTHNPSIEDESWTLVPAVQRPGISWSYDGENFSPPIEE